MHQETNPQFLPLLIDFDGVLRIENDPAPFLRDFLEFLTEKRIPFCILSNSTLRTSGDMRKFIDTVYPCGGYHSMTAAEATALYIKAGYNNAAVYCSENVMHLFDDVRNYDYPEVVVAGDLQEGWDYETVNNIFRHLIRGADFVAMHKNKYWKPPGKEISVDAGVFINGLEYATGKTATVIGKPSPLYFRTALKDLGFDEATPFLMIGDDIESDIAGAEACGGKGILVFTGKTNKEHLSSESLARLTHYAENLHDVIQILNRYYQ